MHCRRNYVIKSGRNNVRKVSNYVIDDRELDELWAPFEALKGVFDVGHLPRKRMIQANDSLLADLLGENPKAPPRSELSPETLDLTYAILQIYSPINRFDVYKIMFKYYPWRARVSKSDHFECAYYLFAHECYIFEERLKTLFDAMGRYAKRHGISINLKAISREAMKQHRSTFEQALRSRGKHVHEEDFVPRDIKRIGLLGLMLIGSDDGNPTGLWKRLQAQAISDAQKRVDSRM